MEIRKNLVLYIILFSLLTVSCNENKLTSNVERISKKQYNFYNIINNNEMLSILKIDERCIGCGKCIIIAPSIFSMNINTLKAKVINQKNIFGEKISNAIKVCPTNSISRS